MKAMKAMRAMKTPASSPNASPSLPSGWKMITKVRRTGQTKGTTDKYYIQDSTGFVARSLIELHKAEEGLL